MKNIPVPITLIISMSFALLGSIAKKYYIRSEGGGLKNVFLYNGVGCIVSAAILFLWGGIGSVSLFTLLLGILFGIITSLQAVLNLKALEIGPLSYTTVIISCSTLITALSGAMFFGESIAIVQYIGIGTMLISLFLSVEKKNEGKKASAKWLIVCLLAFACSGGIGLMQKIHQSSQYKDELNAFLVIAFASAFVFSALTLIVLYVANKSKDISKNESETKSVKWLIIGNMLIGGVSVAVNNKLNLYLSGVMDSAVFFPIVNGGGVALVTLAAVVIFREKLTLKQWIGIAFGVVSIILLCNPF